jgi:hypothetical protein
MKQQFILIQPEGAMPLYHFMNLAIKLRTKIIFNQLSGTYTPQHFEPLLQEVTEQLNILYN